MKSNHVAEDSDPARLRAIFMTPYDQYPERDGQEITLLAAITRTDAQHDPEVLPMFRARFADGEEIEVWPEEIASGERDVTEFIANAVRQVGSLVGTPEAAVQCESVDDSPSP